MKISRIVDLHADAGWRVFSFLEIETDAGLIGWSEYNESYGSKGLTAVIMKLAEMLIGQDPRPVELITANLYARTRQAPGGLIQQAIAAIENALVDVKAKALGVPVCEMLGGPIRDRLRLYWSHCGTYRLHHAEKMGLPPIRTLDDIRTRRARARARLHGAQDQHLFVRRWEPGTLHARPRSLARWTRAQLVAPRRGGARQQLAVPARTSSSSSISISTSRPRATSASSVRWSGTG
jgi:L-alanine-DL-glutamate epimerase-like enolase superfamily enzyme